MHELDSMQDHISQTKPTRNELNTRRGNFYYGLGFALLAGLLVVVALGLLGITSLGILSASTAFAMVAIAICLLSLVSFVTLFTLRKTIALLGAHEKSLEAQIQRHTDLATKVQSQWRTEQANRDRTQDAALAAVVSRQSGKFARPGGATVVVASRTGRRASAAFNPFGDVHAVRDIEGIGEHYGALLNDLGIQDTQQLWNANVNTVATGLNVNPGAVQGWQKMAELMAVKGIGKQYAELLVRADVASIDQLGAEAAKPLLRRIQREEDSQTVRIQGNSIGTKAVKSWIDAARGHRGTRPIVTVLNRNGA